MMNNSNQPIAIISLSGRFPGGVNNPQQLWHALLNGKDLVEEVPDSRWQVERFVHPQAKQGLAHISRWGGFLQDVDQFDPHAFGISPREAETLDPAQRLLLETAWRCWENAGIAPSAWAKRSVGVFVGAFTQDYLQLQLGGVGNTNTTVHSATGVMQTLLSNRISYCFDFNGPSMTVDTACSSSLLAIHLAKNSVQSGESELALAGGVQLQLTPHYTAMESRGGFLSPAGRCRSFDHRADGYVRAEAVGMVLLAPLDRALTENWPIQAVIHGSATNQNGKPAGITLPNSEAQKDLISQTLQQAKLSPDDIAYVEAHGTGTSAGDRAEATALGQSLGQKRSTHDLLVGSVKTNLGHAEAAAGVTGLIKTVLCMQHQLIPPHLHWQQFPQDIHFNELGLRLPLTAQAWPSQAQDAAINAFGFGGSNVHMIIGPTPKRQVNSITPLPTSIPTLPYLLTLSGPSKDHLPLQAKALHQFIKESKKRINLQEVCSASLYQRQHFSHRLVVVVKSRQEILDKLEGYIDVANLPEWIQKNIHATTHLKHAWVFSGMGPQWRDMGKELQSSFPLYRQTIEQCDVLFKDIAGFSILEELANTSLDKKTLPTELAQPLNLFFQIGLIHLLNDWGIKPCAVIGHSVGEIAAFYQAKAIDLKTAIALVFHRSRLQSKMAGQGGMMAVNMGAADIAPILEKHNLSLAAINSNSMVTVAGHQSDLDKLDHKLTSINIHCKRLTVEVPYHSQLMDPLEQELKRCLCDFSFNNPCTALYSTVTGDKIEKLTSINFAEYWWRNIREPVNFLSATQSMSYHGCTVFQELSAHPVLKSYLIDTSDQSKTVVVPTIRRGISEPLSLLESVGQLFECGVVIDWQKIYQKPNKKVEFPEFVWQHHRFWSESPESHYLRLATPDHPLLGYRHSGSGYSWEIDLAVSTRWQLADHCVMGRARVPAAVFIEMAYAAAQVIAPYGNVSLSDLHFYKGVTIVDKENLILVTKVDELAGNVKIYGPQQTVVFDAVVISRFKEKIFDKTDIKLPDLCYQMTGSQYYEALKPLGYDYGLAFNLIQTIHFDTKHYQSQIVGSIETDVYYPPSILDSGLQTMLPVEWLAQKENSQQGKDRLPIGIHEIVFHKVIEEKDFPLTATGTLIKRDSCQTIGNLMIQSAIGTKIIEFFGVTLQSINPPSALIGNRKPTDILYQLVWKSFELPAKPLVNTVRRQWLIWSCSETIGSSLANLLRLQGEDIHLGNPRCDDDSGWTLLASSSVDRPLIVIDLHALDFNENNTEKDAKNLSEIGEHYAKQCRLSGPYTQSWLITCGAQNDTQIFPFQTALWGLGRSLINIEHTDTWQGLVDIAVPDIPSPWQQALLDLIECGPKENQFHWRNGHWLKPQMIQSKPTIKEPRLWLSAKASYLVTGAFGALGQLTVNYLIDHGARYLVLMGNTLLPNREYWHQQHDPMIKARIDWIQSIEERGIKVMATGFDISEPSHWQDFIKAISLNGFPSCRGIIHAAGVISDTPLIKATLTNYQKIIGTKVSGIVNLLESINCQTLDFVLLYSSIAGFLPSYGQSIYAAANNYLDGLAYQLRANGVPARSIAWGPWTIGMADNKNLIKLFTQQGLQLINPDEGYKILDTAIFQESTHTYSVGIDWQQFIQHQSKTRWLFEEILSGLEITSSQTTAMTRCSLQNMDKNARQSAALEDLIHYASRVMRSKSADLNATSNLSNVGMDSLMSAEMQVMIRNHWQCELSITDLLGRDSLMDLATKLSEKVLLQTSNHRVVNQLIRDGP